MILAALLFPAVAKSLKNLGKTSCLNNLRQLGIAMQSFAHDHADRYPMVIPTLQGGSMYENRDHLPASPLLSFSPRHFQVLSNELARALDVLNVETGDRAACRWKKEQLAGREPIKQAIARAAFENGRGLACSFRAKSRRNKSRLLSTP
jgi:hypothetical protein